MDAKGRSKPKILEMLNVKYVTTNRKTENPNFLKLENAPGAYEKKNAPPKAWLVGSINPAKTQTESLMEVLLTKLDPANNAIVLNYTGPDLPSFLGGDVKVKYRTENQIKLISNSKSGGLLVLSEIYYESGWKAFINGEEVPIYQTNHVLRSIYVPDGKNEVVFEYDVTSLKRTKLLSRISLLTLLLIVGSLSWKERNLRKKI
jgi:Predicted membrane protein